MGVMLGEMWFPVDAGERQAYRQAATAEAEEVWSFYREFISV